MEPLAPKLLPSQWTPSPRVLAPPGLWLCPFLPSQASLWLSRHLPLWAQILPRALRYLLDLDSQVCLLAPPQAHSPAPKGIQAPPSGACLGPWLWLGMLRPLPTWTCSCRLCKAEWIRASVEESEQAGDGPRRGERPRLGEECRGGDGVRWPERPRRLPSELSAVRSEPLSWTPLSVSDRTAWGWGRWGGSPGVSWARTRPGGFTKSLWDALGSTFATGAQPAALHQGSHLLQRHHS